MRCGHAISVSLNKGNFAQNCNLWERPVHPQGGSDKTGDMVCVANRDSGHFLFAETGTEERIITLRASKTQREGDSSPGISSIGASLPRFGSGGRPPN